MAAVSPKPVAIVTGAGGDIGLETVRCLQRDGWAVSASSLELTDDLAAALSDDDLGTAGDLTEGRAIDALIKQTLDRFGRLDGLVNGAGASGVATFHEQTDAQWDKFIDLNLSVAFKISRAFIAACLELEKTPRSIVHISSLAVLAGGANPAYGAAKAGVCTMVYNIAQTYGANGLRANAVMPGIIDTQMVRNAFPGEKYQQLKEKAAARTPVGRLGAAEDVAELCAFLMSDRASFITGEVVRVTGGFELVPPIGRI